VPEEDQDFISSGEKISTVPRNWPIFLSTHSDKSVWYASG